MIKINDILDLELGLSKTIAECKNCLKKHIEFTIYKKICRLPKILMIRVEKTDNLIINLNEFGEINLMKYVSNPEEEKNTSIFKLN